MKRLLDLSQVQTAELREIRNVLKFGAKAYASKAGDEARKLRKENAELKRKEQYREIVASYGLDFNDDPDYWLSFDNEDRLTWICKNLANARKETALAEITGSVPLRIPPIRHEEQPSGIEFIRMAFKERKNGHRELE